MPGAEPCDLMNILLRRAVSVAVLALAIICTARAGPGWPAEEIFGNYDHHSAPGRRIEFVTREGTRLRVTRYGDGIVRVQAARNGEEFFPDDRYEMVESHAWGGKFRIDDRGPAFALRPSRKGLLTLSVRKRPMRITFFEKGERRALLTESTGVSWGQARISDTFVLDSTEHFTGLGHGFFGRSGGLDLRGKEVRRNYGSAHGDQAPLIVPLYLSSRGYGVFLNSTFPNSFSFGSGGLYQFSIQGDGRMDYFVIAGPSFASILDRYTQLTGRPRFPPIAVFGLGLSDKANDESSPDPSDEAWWKRKVEEHRNAGFPLDHLINDNRWRAGGGKRCDSYFEWDSTRFTDPAEYGRWIAAHGLFVTIDFNRCIAARSDGWSRSFNIPVTDGIDHGESAPDFTRRDVREWFWTLHWRKSLDPVLGFPGDALWIDEFDELGSAPPAMILGNGRTWEETKNYWFFLIAKALVQEGWDTKFTPAKRPFVWIRGMTAGAQRYATLWSGDIRPTYEDMKETVRGMQLAGLSGFPYWGHDAGGFYDWERGKGPDELMYRRWSMAMGSFSPYWKPHGMGQSRWPLDHSAPSQADARTYAGLRYRLIPYTYTYAHEASAHGIPIARAMVIERQNDPAAWRSDLEYMWGSDMLVAPNCSDRDSVNVWLPEGKWYDFWNDTCGGGGRTIICASPGGKLPLFVRAGSVIPMAEPALSMSSVHRDTLIIHVYTGAGGRFSLYEDDGTSELYRVGESRTTEITYSDREMTLSIAPSAGTYAGAPPRRAYRIVFHGLRVALPAELNGKYMKDADVVWDGHRLSVNAGILPVTESLTLRISRNTQRKPRR
jgi:alpha-glucosidase (family GH31 glycosyl hydrolase)